jgi:ATPase subunit of ABC transporter with duplicated ATPase domains
MKKKKTKKAAKKAVRVKAKPKKAKKAAAKAKPKSKSKPKAKKKKAKKAAAKPALSVLPPANGILVGRVEDFFAHINVIAFTVQKRIRVGARLHVIGHTTNIEQTLDSMQIEHQPVTEAGVNAAVGIKVNGRARRGDHVFVVP